MAQREQRARAQRAPSEQIPIRPLLRAAGLLAGVAALILLAFLFMRDSGAPKALIAVVALTIGIGGVWGMFYAGNGVVDALPRRLRDAVRPWLFVGPAILIAGIYIVFPAVAHDLDQLLRPHFTRVRRPCELRFHHHRRGDAAGAPQHLALGGAGAVVLGGAGAADRGSDRPYRALRGAHHQGADLPPDGDIVRRRQRDLALRLLLPASRLSTGRPAERHRHRARRRAAGVADAASLECARRPVDEQPVPDLHHDLAADRLRHGDPVRRREGRAERAPWRRRVSTAPGNSESSSVSPSRTSAPPCSRSPPRSCSWC